MEESARKREIEERTTVRDKEWKKEGTGGIGERSRVQDQGQRQRTQDYMRERRRTRKREEGEQMGEGGGVKGGWVSVEGRGR